MFVTSIPQMVTLPAVGRRSAPAIVSSVVLPDPDGPITATISPPWRWKVTSSSAVTLNSPERYTLLTSSRVSVVLCSSPTAALPLPLEHRDGIDAADAADGDIGGDQRHEQGGPGDEEDVLPAHEHHELRHGVLCEGRQEHGDPGAHEEAQHAGDDALLEDHSVEESVGEPFCFQDAVFAGFLYGRRIDGEPGHGQSHHKGHDQHHYQDGEDVSQDAVARLLGEVLAADELQARRRDLQAFLHGRALAGVCEADDHECAKRARQDIQKVYGGLQRDEGHLRVYEVAAAGIAHDGQGLRAPHELIADLHAKALAHLLIDHYLARAGRALAFNDV